MKKFLSLFYILYIVTNCFAETRTVCNDPATVAQFSSIQLACDSSNSGDTVYVLGSSIPYDAFTVNNKKLFVFGPGWNPDKELPLSVIVKGCSFTGTSSSGSELHGLSFIGNITLSTIGVNDLKFIRNRFEAGVFVEIKPSAFGNISGYLFEGNWFDNSYVTSNSNYNLSNFIFRNNIFYENGCCIRGNIHGFINSNNILFDHNLWYGPSSGSRNCFDSSCASLTLTNNIFIHRNAAEANSSSTFSNNITYNTTNDQPWTVNSNINGGGNLPSTDPQIVDMPSVNNGVNNPLLDFTISSGAADNAGSDGKDIGLLFDLVGILNWINSRDAYLPFISKINITTPVVPPGGVVSVTLEGKKNN